MARALSALHRLLAVLGAWAGHGKAAGLTMTTLMIAFEVMT